MQRKQENHVFNLFGCLKIIPTNLLYVEKGENYIFLFPTIVHKIYTYDLQAYNEITLITKLL